KYCLSINKSGRVWHCRIHCNNNGEYFLNNSHSFATVETLITYYITSYCLRSSSGMVVNLTHPVARPGHGHNTLQATTSASSIYSAGRFSNSSQPRGDAVSRSSTADLAPVPLLGNHGNGPSRGSRYSTESPEAPGYMRSSTPLGTALTMRANTGTTAPVASTTGRFPAAQGESTSPPPLRAMPRPIPRTRREVPVPVPVTDSREPDDDDLYVNQADLHRTQEDLYVNQAELYGNGMGGGAVGGSSMVEGEERPPVRPTRTKSSSTLRPTEFKGAGRTRLTSAHTQPALSQTQPPTQSQSQSQPQTQIPIRPSTQLIAHYNAQPRTQASMTMERHAAAADAPANRQRYTQVVGCGTGVGAVHGEMRGSGYSDEYETDYYTYAMVHTTMDGGTTLDTGGGASVGPNAGANRPPSLGSESSANAVSINVDSVSSAGSLVPARANASVPRNTGTAPRYTGTKTGSYTSQEQARADTYRRGDVLAPNGVRPGRPQEINGVQSHTQTNSQIQPQTQTQTQPEQPGNEGLQTKASNWLTAAILAIIMSVDTLDPGSPHNTPGQVATTSSQGANTGQAGTSTGDAVAMASTTSVGGRRPPPSPSRRPRVTSKSPTRSTSPVPTPRRTSPVPTPRQSVPVPASTARPTLTPPMRSSRQRIPTSGNRRMTALTGPEEGRAEGVGVSYTQHTPNHAQATHPQAPARQQGPPGGPDSGWYVDTTTVAPSATHTATTATTTTTTTVATTTVTNNEVHITSQPRPYIVGTAPSDSDLVSVGSYTGVRSGSGSGPNSESSYIPQHSDSSLNSRMYTERRSPSPTGRYKLSPVQGQERRAVRPRQMGHNQSGMYDELQDRSPTRMGGPQPGQSNSHVEQEQLDQQQRPTQQQQSNQQQPYHLPTQAQYPQQRQDKQAYTAPQGRQSHDPQTQRARPVSSVSGQGERFDGMFEVRSLVSPPCHTASDSEALHAQVVAQGSPLAYAQHGGDAVPQAGLTGRGVGSGGGAVQGHASQMSTPYLPQQQQQHHQSQPYERQYSPRSNQPMYMPAEEQPRQQQQQQQHLPQHFVYPGQAQVTQPQSPLYTERGRQASSLTRGPDSQRDMYRDIQYEPQQQQQQQQGYSQQRQLAGPAELRPGGNIPAYENLLDDTADSPPLRAPPPQQRTGQAHTVNAHTPDTHTQDMDTPSSTSTTAPAMHGKDYSLTPAEKNEKRAMGDNHPSHSHSHSHTHSGFSSGKKSGSANTSPMTNPCEKGKLKRFISKKLSNSSHSSIKSINSPSLRSAPGWKPSLSADSSMEGSDRNQSMHTPGYIDSDSMQPSDDSVGPGHVMTHSSQPIEPVQEMSSDQPVHVNCRAPIPGYPMPTQSRNDEMQQNATDMYTPDGMEPSMAYAEPHTDRVVAAGPNFPRKTSIQSNTVTYNTSGDSYASTNTGVENGMGYSGAGIYSNGSHIEGTNSNTHYQTSTDSNGEVMSLYGNIPEIDFGARSENARNEIDIPVVNAESSVYMITNPNSKSNSNGTSNVAASSEPKPKSKSNEYGSVIRKPVMGVRHKERPNTQHTPDTGSPALSPGIQQGNGNAPAEAAGRYVPQQSQENASQDSEQSITRSANGPERGPAPSQPDPKLQAMLYQQQQQQLQQQHQLERAQQYHPMQQTSQEYEQGYQQPPPPAHPQSSKEKSGGGFLNRLGSKRIERRTMTKEKLQAYPIAHGSDHVMLPNTQSHPFPTGNAGTRVGGREVMGGGTSASVGNFEKKFGTYSDNRGHYANTPSPTDRENSSPNQNTEDKDNAAISFAQSDISFSAITPHGSTGLAKKEKSKGWFKIRGFKKSNNQ
ncbi:hypothetical protein SARC_08377, partial [Sphaeroforma arctica JP610]